MADIGNNKVNHVIVVKEFISLYQNTVSKKVDKGFVVQVTVKEISLWVLRELAYRHNGPNLLFIFLSFIFTELIYLQWHSCSLTLPTGCPKKFFTFFSFFQSHL